MPIVSELRIEGTDGDLHDTDSRRPDFRCAQGRASGGDQGAHVKTTGAPRDLTQATVLEISSACFWLHGKPLECHQIFVHGFVAGDAGHSSGPALRDAMASAW